MFLSWDLAVRFSRTEYIFEKCVYVSTGIQYIDVIRLLDEILRLVSPVI